jgi:hypothetical protein
MTITTVSYANESTSLRAKPLISVFHSGSGHTAEMFYAIAKGALSGGDVSVIKHQILD